MLECRILLDGTSPFTTQVVGQVMTLAQTYASGTITITSPPAPSTASGGTTTPPTTGSTGTAPPTGTGAASGTLPTLTAEMQAIEDFLNSHPGAGAPEIMAWIRSGIEAKLPNGMTLNSLAAQLSQALGQSVSFSGPANPVVNVPAPTPPVVPAFAPLVVPADRKFEIKGAETKAYIGKWQRIREWDGQPAANGQYHYIESIKL